MANHAGNYTCKAKNIAGHTTYTAVLVVNGIYIISIQFVHVKLWKLFEYNFIKLLFFLPAFSALLIRNRFFYFICYVYI